MNTDRKFLTVLLLSYLLKKVHVGDHAAGVNGTLFLCGEEKYPLLL